MAKPEQRVARHVIVAQRVPQPHLMAFSFGEPADEIRQKPMSSFNSAKDGVFDSLIASGLVENNGKRQKNPKRVAAALAWRARERNAKRVAKGALAAMIGDDTQAPRPRRRPGYKPIGQRQYDRVLRVMQPGQWHARGDMARAAGYGLDARGSLTRALLANALVKRVCRRGPTKGPGNNPEPDCLYSLTPKGEALAALCKMLT